MQHYSIAYLMTTSKQNDCWTTPIAVPTAGKINYRTLIQQLNFSAATPTVTPTPWSDPWKHKLTQLQVLQIWHEWSQTRTLILKRLLRSFWFMHPKKPETWDKLCSIKLRQRWEKVLNNQANGLALHRTIHPSKSQSMGVFPVNFLNFKLSGKKGNL